EISGKYFSWIHLWMPIVSKSKWKRLTGPLARPTPDVKLLLFAMKVLLWTPSGEAKSRQPRHREYTVLKEHLAEAEAVGIMTLELLQAWILTTIYEYAHGVYPAPYISIGTCFRYSLALGLNRKDKTVNPITIASDAQEERRRVWWSIIILDRIIS
ncbi:uncharacterized protein A1O9_02063, partial [Exophiala aquamarina CBS 119918]